MANTENLAPNGHLELAGHKIQGAAIIFPGVRGKLTQAVTANDGTDIPAGSKVIIQPLNRDKPKENPKFLLTVYQDTRKGANAALPESQRNIVTLQQCTISFAKPEQFLKFNSEHFSRSDAPLFPLVDSPSVREIQQSRIPDCFLLAAIQAVLNHPNGKSFIRGMMRQNDDGTTTVRLFDPETLEPEYIRVENSIIVDERGEINTHYALWVHILEKAFAARGKHNNKVVDASISSVYSNGGQTLLAVQTLTGIKSEYRFNPVSPLQIEAFLGKEYQQLQASVQINFPIAKIAQLIEMFLDTNPKQYTAFNQLFGMENPDATARAEALVAYSELLKLHVLTPQHVEQAVKNCFPDTLPFSGYYSPSQLETYSHINAALAEGKLMAAGTQGKFDEPVAGLVTTHAYTVMGIHEEQVKVKDEDGVEKMVTAKFVRLRNPWGEKGGKGRAYKQNTTSLDIVAEQKNTAEFNLELKDFCRYFNNYSVSASVNNNFHRDAEKEKCIAEINQFTRHFAIDFTCSNIQLIEANEYYQSLLKKLIQLELFDLSYLGDALINNINGIFNDNFTADLEKQAVTGLLDANMFHAVAGNENEVKDYIFSLLKLNWLKTQNQPEKLLEVALMMTRVNANHCSIDYMLKLADILQHNLSQLEQVLAGNVIEGIDFNASVQRAIANFMSLERMYMQLLNLDLVVNKFDYASGNSQQLVDFADLIQHAHGQINALVEAQPLFNDLWTLRDEIRHDAANLGKKHAMTPEELQEVQFATECMFTGRLKPIGQTLLASDEASGRHKLGEKILAAETLISKIKRLLSNFFALFSKLSVKIGLFARHQDSYEISTGNSLTVKPKAISG
jgi:hypothetical protein